MPAISGGLTYGFSAILIPQLQSEDADISISLEQGSWIGDAVTQLTQYFYCSCPTKKWLK